MRSVARQGLDEMIEAQPEAPAMMIKGHGKQQREREEDHENLLVKGAYPGQTDEVGGQNDQLRGDDVDGDRPDEETLLALKERAAHRALVLDLERRLNDGRKATDGTAQTCEA